MVGINSRLIKHKMDIKILDNDLPALQIVDHLFEKRHYSLGLFYYYM